MSLLKSNINLYDHLLKLVNRAKHEIILLALKDKQPEIRIVASGSNDLLDALLDFDSTGNLIMQLAQDTNPNVRSNIARLLLHPKLTELDPTGDIFYRRLLQDESSFVRINVINSICAMKKTKVRDTLIKEISQSDDIRSRAHIARVLDMKDLNRLNLLDSFLSDTSNEIKYALFSRVDIGNLLQSHPELVTRFLQDDDHTIRAQLVHNINGSIDPSGELIRQLSQDKHEQVRTAVAYRKDLSDDLIMQLAQDEDSYIRKIIAQMHGETLLDRKSVV